MSTVIQDAIRVAHRKGYRVNDKGMVVSPSGKLRKLKSYSAPWSGTGRERTSYHRFNVVDDRGVRVPIPVHKLAAYQLYGERAMEEGVQVRHLDSNSLNNRLSNLKIGTASDNSMDQPEHERKQRAKHAATFTRRLTKRQATQLKRERERGWSYADLSDKYDLHFSTISDIVNGRLYQDE